MENWQELLGDYSNTLSKVSVGKKVALCGLDSWYTSELRHELSQAHFVTKDQLLKITDWKLNRGVWRPGLKKLVESNSDAEIKKITREAFEILNTEEVSAATVKSSLDHLRQLKGVGPATASAVLSAFTDVPFMSDEGLSYFGIPLKYTLKDYMLYYDKMTGLLDDVEDECSLRSLEQAIWVTAMKNKLSLEDKTKHTSGELELKKRPVSEGNAKTKSSTKKKRKTEK